MGKFIKLVGKLALVAAALAGVIGYIEVRNSRRELEN